MANFSGKVTGGTLAFRSSPGGNAISGKSPIPNNTSLNVSTFSGTGSNEWFTTSYSGSTGYVMSRWIAITSGGVNTATISTASGPLNIRATPSSGGSVSFTVAKGATVQILQGPTSGFYRIGCSQGTGWGSAEFLTIGGSTGGGGTGTGSQTAIICQGNTDSASDCRAFDSALSAKYSSVTRYGYTTSSDTPSSTRASDTNFKNAKGYDVLYWSSHGDKTPYLNLSGGPGSAQFNARTVATSTGGWCSTSNKLKVAFLAACRQMDEAPNRLGWANIMRQSDIRAICSYHEGAPGHPYDKNVANSFFSYVNQGSTGNSVWYSWQRANEDNGNRSTYMVLVYYNDNQCYYRLPGFSSQTYRAPNRSTDSIYAYASFMSGAVKAASNAPQSKPTVLPYELVIADGVKATKAIKTERAAAFVMTDDSTGGIVTSYGENPMIAISSSKAQVENEKVALQMLGQDIIDKAQMRNLDTVMFEVNGDGTEGEHIVIGRTTQFLNHFNGIPLERNCFVVRSDANGLNSFSNKWRDVTPVEGTAMIQNQASLSEARIVEFEKALKASKTDDKIKEVSLAYIEKDGRYVLQKDVEFTSGKHILIDCKTDTVAN